MAGCGGKKEGSHVGCQGSFCWSSVIDRRLLARQAHGEKVRHPWHVHARYMHVCVCVCVCVCMSGDGGQSLFAGGVKQFSVR